MNRTNMYWRSFDTQHLTKRISCWVQITKANHIHALAVVIESESPIATVVVTSLGFLPQIPHNPNHKMASC